MTSLNLLFVYIQGSPPLCQAIFSNKPHTHTNTHAHTDTHTHQGFP